MWFHCSAFIREGGDPIPAYVTGLSLRRPLIAGIPGRAVSFGHLVWNEKHVPIRPEHAWRARASTEWAWRAESAGERMDVRLKIPWRDMVVAEHRDPQAPSSMFTTPTSRPAAFGWRRPGAPPPCSPRRAWRTRRSSHPGRTLACRDFCAWYNFLPARDSLRGNLMGPFLKHVFVCTSGSVCPVETDSQGGARSPETAGQGCGAG